MTSGASAKIELDIRDSVPDWTPYLPPKAPDGAPNVLYIAWDDVGYGTMDVFGGPVETPNMRRIADMGVRFSNFHTTALCSPTRSSLLTGRNATSNGMATIAEFSSGFPGISTRIPFENGFISEVLVERGYNTYCVGKWHLTPGEECNLAAYKGRWPLGRGFERFYGFLGGEANQWYPDLVQDNSQIDAPGDTGGRVPPVEGSRRPGDRDDPGRQGDRPRQAVLHVPRARVRARATPRVRGVGRQVQGQVRPGLRGHPRGHPRAAEGARTAPRRHRAVADQPARRARRAPVPTASPGRCSTRCVRGTRSATTSSASSPAWPRCSPGSSPTPTTRSVACSTTSRSRGSSTTPSSSSCRTTARAARAARTARSTSGGSSTAWPTRPSRRFPTSTSSARRSRTTTTAPVGRGRSTRRSRTGSGGRATRAASPTCAWSRGRSRSSRPTRSATSTSTRSTSSRRSTTCSASSRPR